MPEILPPSTQAMIVRIPNNRLSARNAVILHRHANDALRSRRAALLVDLSRVARITHCGLAALIEFFAQFGHSLKIGFCHAKPKVLKVMDGFGLTRSLPMYGTVEDALSRPEFRQCSLAGIRAVILCAGKGARMAPLSWDTPKPMLDVFGRPVIEHLMLHLEKFGVHDIWLNPGHLGDQIVSHYRGVHKRNIQFANEGSQSVDGWEGAPLGSASTLAKLHHQNSALADDFIVMCGDALVDIDFAEMMACHKSSGAQITIATKSVDPLQTGKYGVVATDDTGAVTGFQEKPAPGRAVSNLASIGIYIFSPAVLELINLEDGQDIARHLLPAVLAHGGKIQSYTGGFYWHDMGCGQDYARVLSLGLSGKIPGLQIAGNEIAQGVWAAPDADVSTQAKITGPCFIGAGSVIRPHANLIGSCVLGAHCRVETNAHLENSILHPGTAIRAGSRLSNRIVSPFWSIETTKADGRTTATEPLENVTRVSQPEATKAPWFSFGKVG